MNNNFILSEYIKFEAKPEEIPYHYRLSYRVSLTVLILKMTSGRSGCSLAKIHLITTSMYTEKEMKNLNRYIETKSSVLLNLRYDPTVNNTIDFMLSDKLIFQQQNGLYRLTKEGTSFANNILKDKTLLEYEKLFLNKISTNLNESVMNKIRNTLMG